MNNHKEILDRILALSGVSLTVEKTSEDGKCELILKDLNDESKLVWLSDCSPENQGRMKYDKLYLVFDDTEDMDMMYTIFLEYIREEKLFTICGEGSNGDAVVLFTIPSYSNLAELQIKMDML